jgi:MFS transporter, DHA1 family, inner membrane transport protein
LSKTTEPSQHIGIPIAGITFFRLVLNTSKRFAYPFAPVLSRGLDVSLTAITSLIAVNQITALLGLLVGPLSDRWGYRKMMVAGMAMLGAGMLAAAFFPFYAVVLVALFLAGLGKSVLDPALQAWAGSHVPFDRRALVIGILETSWAASTLIGIPMVAVLIDRYGWRSPFWVMGILGMAGAVTIFFIIPREKEIPDADRTVSWATYLGAYAQLAGNKAALGALGYAFFVSAANDNLFVIYGAWLEKSFGLGLVALGMGTSLIGLAELFGEGLTATISDRLGLKRALFWGLGLTTLSYLALPLLENALSAALVGIALIFLTFEFTMVTSFSLCTEILPASRATMMASFLATAGMGRVLGALLGGFVWQTGGIWATCWLSGGLTVMGMGCLKIGLSDWQRKR